MPKPSVPAVSVCIPVYLTEPLLNRCLESVKMQTLQNLEVIIVDDCSEGRDEKKHRAFKIAKDFKKALKKDRTDISVKFIRHGRNLGLVEARRTAVTEATGDFIYILDSDDTLLPEGLEILYKAQKESGADIVQGLAQICENGKIIENHQKAINKITEGEISGKEVLENWLGKSGNSSYLIGKLFSRDLYQKAFSEIPFLECTMNEEIAQYFFLAHFAKKYCGIKEPVFNYNIDSGITSRTKVDNLERWEKVCSAAAVFTLLFTYVSEKPEDFSETEKIALKILCRRVCKNNLLQLKDAVVPELQEDARLMLEEYWGREMVLSVMEEN